MIFVNINEHPTKSNIKVFYYKDIEHANYFENLLKTSKVNYEKQIDEDGDQTIYFGINKSDFEQVKRLNYLTIGHFRKPFIPDVYLRYFVIFLSIIILTIAFIGTWLSK
ncbi:MAG: hypothetical protein KDB74_12120 [Flavobacteriales bacterium]|nr:hypothetical protein [Flavobacteriales bacterium]